MNLNFRDNQTDKKTLQAQDKANEARQGIEAKKFKEKAKKEKKRKVHQR